MRLAVVRFPLRGKNSSSSKRSSRVSTSSLLSQKQGVEEEPHGAFLPSVKKGSQVAQAVGEAAGLVRGRGRGRRRLGEENPGSFKRSGPSQEESLGGKTGECGGVSSDFLKETPLENSHQETFFGAKLVKRGKTDTPASVRPKITPSLRSYFKILPLVASDESTRFMGPDERAQLSVSKTMEVAPTEVSVEMAVGDNSGGEKDQCSVSAVDFNLQEDQTGEPFPVLMGNDNHALGFAQTSRMEGGRDC
ncbi:hypothetical protein NDU88_006236 [Pleurodeles waltl]|uniref:Uncharacterized protein n=1 Tax=Pleurodeles waltl TaxID=8319 RepID=A0AAV7MF73_PLEWA|nr:hypothetical protein NDU88_006236 [Pleurodeles waltl]